MTLPQDWKHANPVHPCRVAFDKMQSRIQGQYSSIDSFGAGWDAAMAMKRESGGELIAVLQNILSQCVDWKKFSSGKKWHWDCDTPGTVKRIYEIAEQAVEKHTQTEGGK